MEDNENEIFRWWVKLVMKVGKIMPQHVCDTHADAEKLVNMYLHAL